MLTESCLIGNIFGDMNLRLNSKGYYVLSYYKNGNRIRKQLGRDKQKASAQAEQLVSGKITTNGGSDVGLIERFLIRQSIRESSQKSKRTHLSRLQTWLDQNNLSFSDLNYALATAYMMEMLSHMSPSTWNNNLTTYQELYKFGIKLQIFASNPFADITRKTQPIAQEVVLSEQQCEVLINYNFKYHDFFLVLYHTGMRQNDLWNLPASGVNLKQKLLTYKVTKSPNEKSVIIPINNTVCSIFHSRAGKQYPFGELRATHEQKQMLWVLKTIVKDERAETLWLRHTFANRKINEGVPLEALRDLMGHESIRQTERYAKKIKASALLKYV